MENKYKFDIEYPTQIEKQNRINFILDATKKEEQPLITRLKNLFLGPGINVTCYIFVCNIFRIYFIFNK